MTYYVKDTSTDTIEKAREIALKRMKSSKYMFDRVSIHDSNGKLYGEVEKSGKWIMLVRYKPDGTAYFNSLTETGRIKVENTEKPYSFYYKDRKYTFKSIIEARKSILRFLKYGGYLDVYKTTKTGTYRVQRVEVQKSGFAYSYIYKGRYLEYYEIEKNGNMKLKDRRLR